MGHGETVFHERWVRDARNAHGRLSPEYAAPEPVEGVGVDVPRVDEPRDGTTNRQIVDLVLFLPSGVSVSGRDRFVVRGDTYEVEGDAPAISNFFTGMSFMTEVKVRKVTG